MQVNYSSYDTKERKQSRSSGIKVRIFGIDYIFNTLMRLTLMFIYKLHITIY